MAKRKCNHCGKFIDIAHPRKNSKYYCPEAECQKAKEERIRQRRHEYWITKAKFTRKKYAYNRKFPEPRFEPCQNCGDPTELNKFVTKQTYVFCKKPECQKAKFDQERARQRERMREASKQLKNERKENKIVIKADLKMCPNGCGKPQWVEKAEGGHAPIIHRYCRKCVMRIRAKSLSPLDDLSWFGNVAAA